MDFVLQYFKITKKLQELEHSIFLLQIQKELTKNWKKIPIFLELQNWIKF